ncbi:MAG: superoxide dismutase [Woeseiaceae bacterium]
MTFELPKLPYERNALAPHVSEETLNYHYGKHHKAYVDKLNKKANGTPYADMPLEKVIQKSFESKDQGVFNNAAQAWNHTFLWHSMSPDSDGTPSGSLAKKLDQEFGELDEFRKQFKKAATGQFGSGWVWLVAEANDFAIVATPNAENPLTTSATPLLTLDVWEHAYYLDFQNERGKYVDAFLKHLINWEFAQANYNALQSGQGMARTG